ncbi:MAG: dethiobiotin synthase [Sandaracinus sp.]|nr:dethiobiotin synthase [Sandaracinus sp.]MCB9618018.1 dethiobiotin synthase [Sandaracinus sp.]MCB9622247.1 dethiobiotin synthase [Sandaracinus sp.]
MIVLVTATGTDAGKTAFTRGLARALRRRGVDVVAVKPFETGVDQVAEDAAALERAAGVAAPGPWYRASAPVAPWAATLMGEPAPAWEHIVDGLRSLADRHVVTLVEGAGGPRVPIDPEREILDLAVELGAKVLLVAPDTLGVLSFALTAWDAVKARALEAELVLRGVAEPDASARTNALVLNQKLGRACVVLPFVAAVEDDDALADAVEASAPSLFGLLG